MTQVLSPVTTPQASPELSLKERVAHLRPSIQTTPVGQQTMIALSPVELIEDSDPNLVDFCAWAQFSQWNNW